MELTEKIICHFSDYFLTNDKELKIVSELNILILDELTKK